MLEIEKNKLDLQHQRYLQYFSITLITMFTYTIGIVIALLTIPLTKINLYGILVVSSIVYLLLIGFCIRFKSKMDRSLKKVEQLKFRTE